MPRWVSITVTLLAFLTLASSAGFVLSRWYLWDSGVALFMPLLKLSLYAVVACCAYAGLVGIYHTILSVTGLDEAPVGQRTRARRRQKDRALESES